jgi:T5SS/PEP-CTERM-associated repeat protein
MISKSRRDFLWPFSALKNYRLFGLTFVLSVIVPLSVAVSDVIVQGDASANPGENATIGVNQPGFLTVNGGSVLNSADAFIASGNSSAGSAATIVGAGSEWSVNRLNIGSLGDGELTVGGVARPG